MNGTDPILANDLIPVNIADDGTVTQADLGTEWYNYSDKQWANAIILNESFNETTLYDLSGNNFHGTFFNGTQIKEDTEGRI